jgi:hypothetical protein
MTLTGSPVAGLPDAAAVVSALVDATVSVPDVVPGTDVASGAAVVGAVVDEDWVLPSSPHALEANTVTVIAAKARRSRRPRLDVATMVTPLGFDLRLSPMWVWWWKTGSVPFDRAARRASR